MVSPKDRAWEVDVKVTEYLQAGVLLVGVFYPDTRMVSVYRAHGQAAWLGAGEALSDAEVLPGCTCPVAEVFPPQRTAHT